MCVCTCVCVCVSDLVRVYVYMYECVCVCLCVLKCVVVRRQTIAERNVHGPETTTTKEHSSLDQFLFQRFT